MGWVKDRRERKAFETALAAEVERLTPKVEKTSHHLDQQAQKARRLLAQMPGAKPRCEKCGGEIQLQKTKWGRGKTQWRSDYHCVRCHRRHESHKVQREWRDEDRDAAPIT